MRTKILLSASLLVFSCYINGQEDWKPFNLDSIKKNEKTILNILKTKNDPQINSFLKERRKAGRLRYIGLLSIPTVIAGGVSLFYADRSGYTEVTKEQYHFRDGGRFLIVVSALPMALKVKFDLDHKKYYKKAMEKYILLNN